MLPRLLLALALCAASATAASTGCSGNSGKLQKIESPASGVTLTYDLSPGQVYRGKVSSKQTVVGTSGNKIARGFSFEVALLIRGPATDAFGGTLVVARYTGVDIRWGLPGGSPISISDLVSQATRQLEGLEVTFNVDETGKVLHMPEVPQDLPEDLRFVIQEAIDTLETAFLPVPQRALKVGDNWKDDKKRGRKGKLGRYLEGETTTKVDGFFRDIESRTDLTKLTISESEKEVTTAKTGSHEVSKEIQTTAFFAHGDRYLRKLIRDGKTFDPGNATIFAGLEVTWAKDKAAAAAAAAAAGPTTVKQIQDIRDPFHPDYVGGDECQPDGGANPGDVAPAGATPATTAGETVPANPPAAAPK